MFFRFLRTLITEDRSECYWAKSLTKGADAGRNDTALKRAGWARPGRSRVRSLAAAGFLLLLASLLALPMQAQAKTVTTDWGLVASGLGAGDWFRLVVVTSGTRNETVTNIAAYNTFVQNDVSTTGHTDTTSHSFEFQGAWVYFKHQRHHEHEHGQQRHECPDLLARRGQGVRRLRGPL